MALCWTASALMASEKRRRRVTGHQHLWMPEAKSDRWDDDQAVAKKAKSA
jgi:hypothetical protein